MKLQIYVRDGQDLDGVRYLAETEVRVVVRGSAEHQEIIDAQKRAGKSASKTAKSVPGSNRYVMHTVVKGDTISKIAKKYGVSVKSVLDLNGLKENTPIHKGQQLKVKHK